MKPKDNKTPLRIKAEKIREAADQTMSQLGMNAQRQLDNAGGMLSGLNSDVQNSMAHASQTVQNKVSDIKDKVANTDMAEKVNEVKAKAQQGVSDVKLAAQERIDNATGAVKEGVDNAKGGLLKLKEKAFEKLKLKNQKGPDPSELKQEVPTDAVSPETATEKEQPKKDISETAVAETPTTTTEEDTPTDAASKEEIKPEEESKGQKQPSVENIDKGDQVPEEEPEAETDEIAANVDKAKEKEEGELTNNLNQEAEPVAATPKAEGEQGEEDDKKTAEESEEDEKDIDFSDDLVDSKTEKTTEEDGGNLDIGGVGQEAKDATEEAPKELTPEQKAAQEEEEKRYAAEQEIEENQQKAKKIGLDTGRSKGFGKIMTPNEKDDDYTISDLPKDTTWDEWAGAQHAVAKADEEALGSVKGAGYKSSYFAGYNQGIREGQALLQQELAAKKAKKAEENLKDPDFKEGTELGTLVATLTVKGEKTLDYTDAKNNTYTGVNVEEAKLNGFKGVGLDKVAKDEAQTAKYKGAFLAAFNGTYMAAAQKQQQGPTHQEKLEDPVFREEYEKGNQLGRGEGNVAELTEIKKDYFTKESREKTKGNPTYKKQRAGFIYGFNSAYYQQIEEEKAAKKAAYKAKVEDPIFKLALAAGNVKGILLAALQDKKPAEVVGDDQVLAEAGINFTVPPNIAQIVKTDNVDGQQEGWSKEVEKKRKQEEYAAEGYRGGIRQGYDIGNRSKAIYAHNKQKMHPDYQRLLNEKQTVVVREGIEKEANHGMMQETSSKPEPVKWNKGKQAAYFKYILDFGSADDNRRAAAQTLLSNRRAEMEKAPELYRKAYYNEYNTFYKNIYNKNGAEAAAINIGLASVAWGGKKGSEEREIFNKSKEIATKEQNQKTAIQEAKLSTIGKQEALERLSAGVSAERKKLTDKINGLKGDESTEKGKAALSAKKARLNAMVINGREQVLAEKRAKENEGSSERDIKEKTARIAESKSGWSPELIKKAQSLFEQGAAEGYSKAYKESSEKIKKGSGPEEPVGDSKDAEKGTTVLAQRISSMRSSLASKYPEEVEDLLAAFYAGYNKDEGDLVRGDIGVSVQENTKYGYAHGVICGVSHGEGYVLGENDPTVEAKPEGTAEQKKAFLSGFAQGARKASFDDFKKAAMGSDKELKDLLYKEENDETKKFDPATQARVNAKSDFTKLIYMQMGVADTKNLPSTLKDSSGGAVTVDENTCKGLYEDRLGLAREVGLYYKNTEGKAVERHFEEKLRAEAPSEKLTDEERAVLDTKKVEQKDAYFDEYEAAYYAELGKIETEAEAVKLSEWHKALGYKEGFLRATSGMEVDLPSELAEVSMPDNEVEAKGIREKADYMTANQSGYILGIKYKTGEISADELHGALDEESFLDTGYGSARKLGQQQGIAAAESEDCNSILPGLYTDLAEVAATEVPEDVQQAYEEMFWKAKDARGGEMDGIRIVAEKLDAYALGDYYKVMGAEDKEVAGKKKRAVKDANVYENAFINAREAARQSDDLEGLKEEKVDKKPTELLKTKKQVVLEKATKAALKDAHEDTYTVPKLKDAVKKKADDLEVPTLEEIIAEVNGEEEEVDIDNLLMQFKDDDEEKAFEQEYFTLYWNTRDKRTGEVLALRLLMHKKVLLKDGKVEMQGIKLENQMILVNNLVNETAPAVYDGKVLVHDVAVFETAFDDIILLTEDIADKEALLEEMKSSEQLEVSELIEEKRAEQIAAAEEEINKNAKGLAYLYGYNAAAIDMLAYREGDFLGKILGFNISDPKTTEKYASTKDQLMPESLSYLTDTPEVSHSDADEYVEDVAERVEDLVDTDSEDPFLVDTLEEIIGKDIEVEANSMGMDMGMGMQEETPAPKAASKKEINLNEKQLEELRELLQDKIKQSKDGAKSDAVRDYASTFTFDLQQEPTADTSANENEKPLTEKEKKEQQALENALNQEQDSDEEYDYGQGSDDNDTEEQTDDNTGQSDTENEETNEDIPTVSSDISFGSLPIINTFGEQEQLLESRRANVIASRNEVWKLDDKILQLQNGLPNGDRTIEGLTEKIESLEANTNRTTLQDKNLVNYESKRKKLELLREEDQKSIDALTQDLDKKRAEINQAADDVQDFIGQNLVLKTQKDSNTTNQILDYLDYFIETLQLSGSIAYSGGGLNIQGGSTIIVEKNAEDVFLGGSITIDQGGFEFTAGGLEYIENKNKIILTQGSAIVPKLEGASNQSVQGNYTFDVLSFNLNQGVHHQLKLQNEELKAGTVPNSTGARKKTPFRAKLDSDAPQNTETKTDL